MNVRIKEIAAAANVSTATVSLALNNKPGISEATRDKILQISEQLRQDKRKLHSFSAKKTGTIKFLKIFSHGHVLSSDHESFIFRYIDGIEQEARENGFNLDITSTTISNLDNTIKLINNSPINGLIVLATELTDKDLTSFESLNIPVVFIDAILNHKCFDFVDMNNTEAVYQIVKYFSDHNHGKIGMIQSPVEAKNLQLRSQEFPKALEYYGIHYNPEFVYTIDSTFEGAHEDMVKILQTNPQLPTAIFSTNDLMAYASIKALREFGVRVPEDISIIGFDDQPICTVMDPQLTTMKISQRQIGKMAVRLLKNRISSIFDAPSIQISISGELIQRNSVVELVEKN
jgi:DNA-binding LacI/PurR family transcriptional regulator